MQASIEPSLWEQLLEILEAPLPDSLVSLAVHRLAEIKREHPELCQDDSPNGELPASISERGD